LEILPRTPDEYRRWWTKNTQVSYGLCWCGCGLKTKRPRWNNNAIGQVGGQPRRYIIGHNVKPKQESRRRDVEYVPQDRGYDTPCWIWQGCLNQWGYGVKRNGKKLPHAHRYYWERVHGPIPRGLVMHHECRTKDCVNPAHLSVMTVTEHSIMHAAEQGFGGKTRWGSREETD
jgi:hypothetical protein